MSYNIHPHNVQNSPLYYSKTRQTPMIKIQTNMYFSHYFEAEIIRTF